MLIIVWSWMSAKRAVQLSVLLESKDGLPLRMPTLATGPPHLKLAYLQNSKGVCWK
ncbi:hypothetical protein D3C74_506150 [compost metagenome]